MPFIVNNFKFICSAVFCNKRLPRRKESVSTKSKTNSLSYFGFGQSNDGAAKNKDKFNVFEPKFEVSFTQKVH